MTGTSGVLNHDLWNYIFEPPYGYMRTLNLVAFFHQIIDYFNKIVAFIFQIVLGESFIDLILIIERHVHLTHVISPLL